MRQHGVKEFRERPMAGESPELLPLHVDSESHVEPSQSKSGQSNSPNQAGGQEEASPGLYRGPGEMGREGTMPLCNLKQPRLGGLIGAG